MSIILPHQDELMASMPEDNIIIIRQNYINLDDSVILIHAMYVEALISELQKLSIQYKNKMSMEEK